MRISDWSSDVCSSDLLASEGIRHEAALAAFLHDAHGVRVVSAGAGAGPTGRRGFAFEPESRRFVVPAGAAPPTTRFQLARLLLRLEGAEPFLDRKSTRLNSSH